MLIKSLKMYILLSIGSLSLVLGFLGVFLPVLPTTPFLLLSSWCYIRSSEPLYNWLINNKVFGPIIKNYLTYKAIKSSTKIAAMIFLWFTLAISIMIISKLYLRILVFAIGIGVSIHLFTLRTYIDEIPDKALTAKEETIDETSLS